MKSEAIRAICYLVGAMLCVGFALLVRRGRRVGDEPRCAGCDYDLRGRSAETSRCPECAADLTPAGAIRVGGLRPRRGAFRVAIVTSLVALVFCLIHVRRWSDGFNWLPYRPLSSLLEAAKSPPGGTGSLAAAQEIMLRARDGRLTDAQVPLVVSAALSEQAGTAPWNAEWGYIIEALHAEGRLPDADWQRYLDAIVYMVLDLPPVVDVHQTRFLYAESVANVRRGAVVIEGYWNLRELDIDGPGAAPGGAGSPLKVVEYSKYREIAIPVMERKLTPGEKMVTGLFEVEEHVSLKSAPDYPSESRRIMLTAKGSFTATNLSPAERARLETIRPEMK